MGIKNQTSRLTNQHKESQGVTGIFGDEAKRHDLSVGAISKIVLKKLRDKYPDLEFRYRNSIRKAEINDILQKLDSSLGKTLFVENASIKPDGGIIEVKDDKGN